MKIILYLIVVSAIFSIGFAMGAWWNYVHTINKQIERIDEYLKKENERFELIKGGKTELEQLFPKCKYVGPTNNKKVYVLDVDLNKRYYFKSKREAIKKLKLGQKEVKDIRKPKLIKDYKYIICGEKIKIKQIRPGDFLNVIKTGYPKGLYWVENNGGKEYLSIDSRKNINIKKHDCKEAAILYLLDLQ